MMPSAACPLPIRPAAGSSTRRPPHLLVLALGLALLLPGVAPAAEADAELRERLDALFAAAYPADQPGAAVRIQRGDEVLLRHGYGMADLELQVPIAPEMVFRLGSITKQFTSVAVLMLAAEGKVDLQAPLSAYLPAYPGPGAAVTLHQLLTHTGGIPSYTSDPAYWENSRLDRTVEEMIATWKDKPLDFPPGSDWSYSNSGYFLLGAVIEAVSGQSYAEFVQQRIFAPLGMADSHYGDAGRIIPGRVSGYDGGDEGGYANAPYLSMTQPYAAGSLLSNVDDLVRWGEALFGSEELLPAAWRERLVAPARLTDGRLTGYACGLGLREYAGARIIEHGGGINGFATWIAFVPEQNVTVAVLSNNTVLPPGPQRLGQRALAMVLGQPLDERPAVELPPEVLTGYQGVYRLEAVSGDEEVTRVIRVEDGRLTSQRSGGSRLPMAFSAQDRFYFPDSFTNGRFERNAEGEVTGIWIAPQSGAEERYRKTDRPVPTRVAVELEDPSVMDALIGSYELAPGFVLQIRRQGDGLEGQATGQPAFRIQPESETRWFLTEVDAVLVFQGHEDGRADSLILHQGGREMPAKRLD